jgi:LacI family transcriptional regulator
MHQYNSILDGFSGGPQNACVRSSSPGKSRTIRCAMVVQARESFASYVLGAINGMNLKGVSWHAVASRSDQETLELIGTLGRASDVFALFGKNSEQVNAALAVLRDLGIHVLAFLSDLDPAVRSSYIGGDNRASGRLAALIIGRCLERGPQAAVALITSKLAYRAWEDREIGFRSLLRGRFPGVRIIEAITDNDSADASCDDLASALAGGRPIGAIYNVTGENQALTKALYEIPLSRRPLYITHELDGASEPLLRSGIIDFLIVQSLDAVIKIASRVLFDLRAGKAPIAKAQLVPTELLSKFNPEPEKAL